MNSKSSSSTSTIIEYSGMSLLNFDKSWIMNYVSSLREKEENFDNLCCESSQPTMEYHEQSSQDSNNVKTKVQPSSVHRETVASTMRVIPGLLEKQQRRQQQSCVNTSKDKVQLQKRKGSFERTHLDFYSWMTDVEKTLFETLIFK